MLPLIQCPREDYSLRAETVSLLRSIGIGDELLCFGGNATDDGVTPSVSHLCELAGGPPAGDERSAERQ